MQHAFASTSSIQDVQQTILNMNAKRRKIGNETISAKIEPLFNILQKFDKAFDVLAQSAPSPAGLVWGALRVVLEVSG